MATRTKVRRLKVYKRLFDRGGGFLPLQYTVNFPEIRLIGKWLKDCGFEPGQRIEVTTEQGKLTIKRS
ncbi:MAG: SymE family type I addiction module toxin [Chitinophagaceae bacterium]